MEVKIKNTTIFLSENILRILSNHKQRTLKEHERGGILIGEISDKYLRVLKMTLPNKYDESGPSFFVRNKHLAQVLLDYEFVNSNQTRVYLGEWHTHAEVKPSPSSTDLKMIKMQLRSNIIHSNKILLLINGIESFYLGLCGSDGISGKLLKLNN